MESEEILKANGKHLKTFESWLQGKKLTKKTIDEHIGNVDFFINNFLCGYFAMDVTKGCHEIDNFLGDFFIRKTTWSSHDQIKKNAASFKKFYACMLENNVITQEDYEVLCKTIKEYMPGWLNEMTRFEAFMDDPDFFEYFDDDLE